MGFKYDSSEKPKKKNKLIYLVVIGLTLIIILFFMSADFRNPEKEYLSAAGLIVAQYDLDEVTIELEYRGQAGEKRAYDLIVRSDQFSTLSDQDQYDLVQALQQTKLPFRIIVFKSVESNGEVYTYDDYALKKNDEVYYRDPKNPKPKISSSNNTSNNNTSTSKPPSSNNTSFAYVAAKNEVRSRLKSPSSAKFPASSNGQDITEVATNTFVVRSYVESENSFGAMLKVDYMVKIEKLSEESYRVLDIQIYD